jgi:hypothetical protein
VQIIGPKGAVVTHALLDSGSDTTLISQDVVNELGIEGSPTSIEVTSLNGTSTLPTMAVSFVLKSLQDGCSVDVDQAFTIKSLPVTKAFIPGTSVLKRWSHLSDIRPVRIAGHRVSVLIGTNVSEAHWIFEQRKGAPKEPYAYLTAFGWTVLGPAVAIYSRRTLINCITSDPDIDSSILKFFERDFSDNGSHTKTLSVEEKRVFADAERTTALINGHYYVSIPWKLDWKRLHNSRLVAERRLLQLRSRFLKDSDLLVRYAEILSDYEKRATFEGFRLTPQTIYASYLTTLCLIQRNIKN